MQAIIPTRKGRTQSLGLAEIASSLVEAVRGAIPLPAVSRPRLPAVRPLHASADADSGVAQQHPLAHAPYAATLAAWGFAVYCLTRLTLSLVRLAHVLFIRYAELTSARRYQRSTCCVSLQWYNYFLGDFPFVVD